MELLTTAWIKFIVRMETEVSSPSSGRAARESSEVIGDSAKKEDVHRERPLYWAAPGYFHRQAVSSMRRVPVLKGPQAWRTMHRSGEA